MVSRKVAPRWPPLETIQPWKKLSFPHLQDLLQAKAQGVLQAQAQQPEEKLNTGCLPHQMRQEMRSTAGQIQHALSSAGSTAAVISGLFLLSSSAPSYPRQDFSGLLGSWECIHWPPC